MSETVKVGRNRPPQNGWASKEEVAELRAEVAELRETNQAMLEEIKDLRAELGGAKRRHFLGAVATSAAAFFGKFFHRGKDLGDFRDEKEHSKGAKKGAHAKGEEKEKEKSDTPIASARKDEKSKNNSREKEEKEDKQNKDKHPLAKKVAAFALAALMVGGSIAGISQCSNHDINGSDAPITEEMDNKDLENHAFGSTQASAEENDAAKAEAAHQQQLAETMGMSVEDMHAIADRHGVNHNDIGTAKAHDQMRDNMESSYNLSEKVDLEGMSEAERSERSKQEIEFANMNNKYVTAQISSARLGASDGSDAELTRRLFSQYEENDAVWREHAKENAKLLKESTYSTRLAGADKTYTYGTENAWDGLIERQYVVENSGGETVYIVEVANGNMKIQFKDGCVQAVWTSVAQSHQRQERTKTVTSTQRQEERREEDHGGGEIERKEFHWKDKGGGEEHRRETDEKDKTKDDSQEKDEDENKETTGSHDDAGIKRGNQVDNDKDGLPDSDSDSKSGNGEKDIKGSQGKDDSERPGEKNQDHSSDKGTTTDDQGGNDKKKVADGQDKTNDIEDKKGTTDTSDKDSNSRSEHRSWTWSEEGGRRPDGSEYHHRDSSDTGWVDDNDAHSGGNQANDDVELQNIVVPGA